MKYLLDASTFIPLLFDFGEKLLDVATRVTLYVTDLTVYEAGNALWKLVTLLKTMSMEDALETIIAVHTLLSKGLVKVLSYSELELGRVLELATREELTFYDASYVVAAENLRAVLVTENKKLEDRASKYVTTMTYAELVHALREQIQGS